MKWKQDSKHLRTQDRGPNWPFDVERLKPGDDCEFRFPARSYWHEAVVVKNGMSSYWSVRYIGEDHPDVKHGEIVSSLYIEHIRIPQ